MDSIGDRMKNYYEDRQRFYLTRRTPVILRLDGRAFHTLTKDMAPFDARFLECMIAATFSTLEEIQGAKCAYIQSDEVSILITDYDKLNTDAWFDYNIQKVVSVAASEMSVAFTQSLKESAVFDARVFNLPKEEVVNYFIWRQKDWERNSLSTLTLMYCTHKECMNKNSAEKHEMLHKTGVNWANLEDWKKNGVFIERVGGGWVQHSQCPIFTEDRNSIQKHVDVDKEQKSETELKRNVKVITFSNGDYVVNPVFVDYNDGAGTQMCGGTIYSANGKVVGHIDPPGPRGPIGVVDKGAEK